MIPVSLKNVKKGGYFHYKDDCDSPIYVRNHYDRSTKRISVYPYDDVCKERFHKPTLIVYIE